MTGLSEQDRRRLRNWAHGYQRLVRGGLGEIAHTVGIDDFASDEGEYPYITAADVLALLDDVDTAVAAALTEAADEIGVQRVRLCGLIPWERGMSNAEHIVRRRIPT